MTKLLILNITRMGDIIQSIPLLKSLKRDIKDISISYAVLDNFKDTLSIIPEVDEVIPLDFSGVVKNIDFHQISEAFNISENLLFFMDKNFQKMINLSFSKLSGYLLFFSGAKDKSGLFYTSKNQFQAIDNWSRYFLSIVDYRDLSPFNLVDIYSKIGGVELHNDFNTKKGGYKNIGFVLGASTYDRRWSCKNFAKLAEALLKDCKDRYIFIFGTKSEIPLEEEFFNFFKGDTSKVKSLIGKTTIPQLFQTIKDNVDILLTNDTGTMHIGWYAGKCVLELSLGPALYNNTGPYGSGHFVIQPQIECAPCSYQTKCKDLKCHEIVTPEVVFDVLKYMVGESKLLPDYENILILKSCFDENNFLDYSIISGKNIKDIQNRRVLKKIWIDTLENCLKKDKDCIIDSYDNLGLLLRQIDILDTLFKKGLSIIESGNMAGIEDIIELQFNQEEEIKRIVYSDFYELKPFLKYIEYSKSTLSDNNLLFNLKYLTKFYNDFKIQINLFYRR